MRKEYVKPTSIERDVCMAKHYMVALTGARTITGANNAAAEWTETDIEVNNDYNSDWDTNKDLWMD